MTGQDIRLVAPDESWEAEYREYLADCAAAGEKHEHLPAAEADFAGYVNRCREQAAGVDLPEGHVPSETYWLLVDERILGYINLRLALTDRLRDFGGHIGYGLCPSARGQGYGTRMLALMLDVARAKGFGRVLLTCDSDNPASARVMVKNGAVLESESYSPNSERMAQRYWIDLGGPEGAAQ